MNPLPIVRVVIGLIHRDKQPFFIAKRPPRVVMPGFWEFPGGKIEAGESQLQALTREFQEEVGIDITNASYLTSFSHVLPDRELELHLWHIHAYTGSACGNEGQEVRWVEFDQLPFFDFIPSNTHLLNFIYQRFTPQQESLRPLGRSVLDLEEVCKSNKSAPCETSAFRPRYGAPTALKGGVSNQLRNLDD